MSIKVKTVSQLEQISKYDIKNGENYIEISKQESEGYSSKKYLLSDLNDVIVENSELCISNKYNMIDKETNSPIDVQFLNTNINNLLSGTFDSHGYVNFTNPPTVPYPDFYTDNTIPNVEMVKDIIHDSGILISKNSYTTTNPLNTTDNGETFNGSVYSEKDFQYFHFDNGTTDSSKWVDQTTQREVGPLVVNKTGELVIYGWLSDNGHTVPQECWVALLVKLNTGNGKTQWIPIRVSPWIVGKNSQTLQYISFNVKVKKGVELKICTGFKVANYTSGGLTKGNTLLFNETGTVPNTLISYVIE